MWSKINLKNDYYVLNKWEAEAAWDHDGGCSSQTSSEPQVACRDLLVPASQTLHYCALVTPLHELIASACFQQADAFHQIYFSSFLKFVWKSERGLFFFLKANINRGKTPAVVHWAKPPQRGLNVHLIWRRRFVSRLEFTVNLLCLLFHESNTYSLKKKKFTVQRNKTFKFPIPKHPQCWSI